MGWLQLLYGCGICSLSPSRLGVLIAVDHEYAGEGMTCTPANSPGKPASSWHAVRQKLHISLQLLLSDEILYCLYHNFLSEMAGVARNFCVGAGFGWSVMENGIFLSGLSVACSYAPLQCSVNTGPSKIPMMYVLRKLLWLPGFCPWVGCFPKLWCGGMIAAAGTEVAWRCQCPVLDVLLWLVWWTEGR